MGRQRHAPAVLPPGKIRYRLYRRLGGPQDRSGQVRKISPPPRFDPRTVQPVASCYNERAIPDHNSTPRSGTKDTQKFAAILLHQDSNRYVALTVPQHTPHNSPLAVNWAPHFPFTRSLFACSLPEKQTLSLKRAFVSVI